MTSETTPHPGLIIKAHFDKYKLPVSATAEQLGIDRVALYKIFSERRSVTTETALRIEAGLGMKAETLLRAQYLYDLSQLRAKGFAGDIKRVNRKQVS